MIERMGLEIYPVPRFRDARGSLAAALNNDVSSITIDETMSDGAYRYSLAHEGGHCCLHGEYIALQTISGEDAISTWRAHLKNEDPKTLNDLERQADIFARQVLMPDAIFRPRMFETRKKLPLGLDWFTVGEPVFQAMCGSLADEFVTPIGSVVRRLMDYGINRD